MSFKRQKCVGMSLADKAADETDVVYYLRSMPLQRLSESSFGNIFQFIKKSFHSPFNAAFGIQSEVKRIVLIVKLFHFADKRIINIDLQYTRPELHNIHHSLLIHIFLQWNFFHFFKCKLNSTIIIT